MFPSLLTFMVSPLLLQVQAGITCNHRDYFETQIEITVDKKPVNYIRDVTLRELDSRLGSELYQRQKEMGTNLFLSDEDPDAFDISISGTTRADIAFDTDVEFLALPQNPENTRYCLTFKSVTVNVAYQTDMTIAKELEEGDCVYDAVLNHQMKHHHANEKVVDSVIEKLKVDLPSMLPRLEHNYVTKRAVRQTYADMTTGLRNALKLYQDDMDALIKEYGAFIDTPEELKALTNSCK